MSTKTRKLIVTAIIERYRHKFFQFKRQVIDVAAIPQEIKAVEAELAELSGDGEAQLDTPEQIEAEIERLNQPETDD